MNDIDESGRNPTQRQIDEDEAQRGPADVSWDPDSFGELPDEDDEDYPEREITES